MSWNLAKLLRPNVAALKPYQSARDEFSGVAEIYLDANENALGSATAEIHSRYPDPKQTQLRETLAKLKNVPAASVFCGNGSDEAIDLVMRAFCAPGKDAIVITPPTYGMYEVAAGINDVAIEKVALTKDFQLDVLALEKSFSERTKVLFLCSPNNPTGNALKREDLKRAIAAFPGIVVVDEAYVDFCPEKSIVSDLKSFPNLIVLQTLSKAWGLAEIRLGIAIASSEIIAVLDKIKPPYNVSGTTQAVALRALRNPERTQTMIAELNKARDIFVAALKGCSAVNKVYPSDANFLLVQFKHAKESFQKLLAAGIVTRDRSNVAMCEGGVRITVGSEAENSSLVAVLNGEASRAATLSNQNASQRVLEPRRAANERKTSETDIRVDINLDGGGVSIINTGLGFFDHMLAQLSKHSGMDLAIDVKGDLKVDEHHTIEDTAIALGEALSNALGDRRGMSRYGFMLPMDDAAATVSIDFSGRSWLVWNAEFKREKIGEMPTEMFKHFFKSFCDAARCNLNIEVSGDNEHHKIEAIFKALARAIKAAVMRDGTLELPSTKGTL